MRRPVFLPAVLVFVFALAACGGGGGTLTRAQYDTKLNYLCGLSADQVRELHLDITVASWRHDGARLVRIERHFLRKLEALKPPAALASAATAYAKANQKALTDTKAAVAAARAGNAAALRRLNTKSNADALATYPSAKRLGAKGCYIG